MHIFNHHLKQNKHLLVHYFTLRITSIHSARPLPNNRSTSSKSVDPETFKITPDGATKLFERSVTLWVSISALTLIKPTAPLMKHGLANNGCGLLPEATWDRSCCERVLNEILVCGINRVRSSERSPYSKLNT